MTNLTDKNEQATRRFVFVLVDGFTLLSFAGAVDALRIANRASGQKLYDWKILTEDGSEVKSSAGPSFLADGPLEELRRDDTLVLVSGVDVQSNCSTKLLNWLRREARRGVRMAGLCTAAHILAKAGLLNDKRATIHWENHDSFAEEFDEVELTKRVFVVDGKVMTAAGGTAAIDLILKIIAEDQGEDVANVVADQQIYTTIRTESDSQRLSVPTRIGVRHPKLSDVIRKMEANIEEPISPSVLATEVGMSTRQLERLFRRYLNRSPKRYYMELRLQKARNLLMQTDMSVINVALSCGFSSPSHFSKCYRSHYDTTPYRERGSRGARPA
ncbi:GlxA family transcriptional regulator [Aliiroseovarius sp. F20344]|uniref:GlxA family transcriptional regulator n=1 Tax=Aliiroseovarius sp. F20344 TaxID=2926414 RepID=UPI001FF1F1DA|nr:GlxA family transcriptional regulator [Aliiroseovarius sp. F20344]MCK0143675.1 GlxA family transcriptional regulator [Aliiroseovarius sp. F20344]